MIFPRVISSEEFRRVELADSKNKSYLVTTNSCGNESGRKNAESVSRTLISSTISLT